jgi:hypothetical protein
MAVVAEKTIEIVKASMQRCLAKQAFMDKFYEEFTASSDVREKFKNTNMAMQKIVLKSSLHLILAVARGYQSEAMNKLAMSHDRNHRAIPPNLYQYWLSAMVSAVKATDTQFSLEIENAWREVMQTGIDFMSDRY